MKELSTAQIVPKITQIIVDNEQTMADNFTEIKYTVQTYELIKEVFKNKSIDISTNKSFQNVYAQFYVMSRVFVSQNFIGNYYAQLHSMIVNSDNLDVKELANKLKDDYEDKSGKQRKSLQFSFVTKLMNLTNDAKYPIYDSMVAKVFGFKIDLPANIDERLDELCRRYEIITTVYRDLLSLDKIKVVITNFRQQFNCSNMSDLRVLDIIIWQIGKTSKAK